MDRLRKFAKGYNAFEKWVMIILFIILIVVIFAQVVSRYVFGQAIYWSEELGKFIFVWVSWIGVSAGIIENEHIQVTLLPAKLYEKGMFKAEKINQLLIKICWIITSAVVFYDGIFIVIGQYATGVYGSSTGIPMWIAYLCIPLTGLAVCMRLLEYCWIRMI